MSPQSAPEGLGLCPVSLKVFWAVAAPCAGGKTTEFGRLWQRDQRTQGPPLGWALLWVGRVMFYSGMLMGIGWYMSVQRQGWGQGLWSQSLLP